MSRDAASSTCAGIRRGRPVCFLYEIYDDATAFQAHLASPHFKAFDVQVAQMVAEKTVRIWTRKEHNR